MRSSIPLLAAVCAIAASPAAAFAPVGGAMPGLRSAPRVSFAHKSDAVACFQIQLIETWE